MTDKELKPCYDRIKYELELKRLDELVGIAVMVSEAVGGIKTTTRNIRATQLYTRLVAGTISFVRNLPANRIAVSDTEWWDWPATAVLARAIIETYNAFYYVGVEKIPAEEIDFRINLMHFHLNSEKDRLYRDWGVTDDDLQSFIDGLPLDKQRLRESTVFQGLSEKQQTLLLRGKTAMHLSHHEIDKRSGILSEDFKPIYRLFSNQVHSTPLAFQSQSNNRGRGIENDAERFYITLSIEVVCRFLATAIQNMSDIFPTQLRKSPYLLFLGRAKSLKAATALNK